MDECTICGGQGLTGWEKPMGTPPTMVFVPQFCQCEAGQSLAKMNAPDAKRTIISDAAEYRLAVSYQVIGCFLDHLGVHDSDKGQALLDYFSGRAAPDPLPFSVEDLLK